MQCSVTLQKRWGDAMTLLDTTSREVSVDEQNNPEFALIVPVEGAGTHLDAVLDDATQVHCDMGAARFGNHDANMCGNDKALSLVDHAVRAAGIVEHALVTPWD